MNTIKVHILASMNQYNTRPENVKLVQDWGHVGICYVENGAEKQFYGMHIAIEGDKHEIASWLGDSFWLGKGSPFLQEFQFFTKE